jgi:hypothetical protein
MMADFSPLVSVAALLVSAAVGGITTWLALRKRSDEDALARATRRTSAMQLLSDEEFTIIRVRDECQNIRHMVLLKEQALGENYKFLASEAQRILEESNGLLAAVQERRRNVEPKIQSLSAWEIEAVIAAAYHGKRLAEAQLQRTLLSKSEVLREYGVFGSTKGSST